MSFGNRCLHFHESEMQCRYACTSTHISIPQTQVCLYEEFTSTQRNGKWILFMLRGNVWAYVCLHIKYVCKYVLLSPEFLVSYLRAHLWASSFLLAFSHSELYLPSSLLFWMLSAFHCVSETSLCVLRLNIITTESFPLF